MKCLVINLDRSTDRLAHVTAEFARVGVPFERVRAVDANESTLKAPPLTAAEVACFQSHRKCWQMIADGHDRHVAIFEDDIVFGRDVGCLLSRDEWIPLDADVVKLETFLTPVKLAKRRTPVGDSFSLARMVGTHVGSAGYIITRDAAKRLLSSTLRMKGAIDNALFSPTLMTCALSTNYQLVPAICIQSQLLDRESGLPSVIQIGPPRIIRRGLIERALNEASRAFAHARNGTFFGPGKVPFVPLSGGVTEVLPAIFLEIPLQPLDP